MKQLVDIDNWKRKENYLFFRNFANPYYTVTSVVDVSKAYDTSKRLGIKFSQFLMYASLKAVNEIESLRYRQIDGKVWLFDSIRLNTAVSLPDHSFISVIVPYKSSLKEFIMSIQEQIDLYEDGLEKLHEGEYEPAGVERSARYSITKDEEGYLVNIDTDQDIFDGVPEEDYAKIAKMYIQDYLSGNVYQKDGNAININKRTEKNILSLRMQERILQLK